MSRGLKRKKVGYPAITPKLGTSETQVQSRKDFEAVFRKKAKEFPSWREGDFWIGVYLDFRRRLRGDNQQCLASASFAYACPENHLEIAGEAMPTFPAPSGEGLSNAVLASLLDYL